MTREELEVRRARGVVRDYGLDHPVVGIPLQLRPQSILVQARADRRAAFVSRIALGNLLGR